MSLNTYWPEQIHANPRRVDAYTKCWLCPAGTFVRYGEKAWCLEHARNPPEPQGQDETLTLRQRARGLEVIRTL